MVEAYQQLVAEGYLTSRSGGYTQVAIGHGARAGPGRRPSRCRPPLRIDFGYGRADVSKFPRAAWLRSVRRVLTEAPNERFALPRRARRAGAATWPWPTTSTGSAAPPARPATWSICTGYAQGIALLSRCWRSAVPAGLAVEDPSSDDDARVARAAGSACACSASRSDRDGIRVDALERSRADAVVLTPSHQWPTGACCRPRSRARVLRWAQGRAALVIEDDYDAEYRYDRSPIGAMQGLAPDRVVYAGIGQQDPRARAAAGLAAWRPAHLVDDVAAAKMHGRPGLAGASTSWRSPTS